MLGVLLSRETLKQPAKYSSKQVIGRIAWIRQRKRILSF